MALITYIAHDGTSCEVDVPSGHSVMEGAIQNSVDGIVAECGGNCVCATCSIMVAEAWRDRLPAMDETEDAMLEMADKQAPGIRLACQIEVSDALDGLVVHMPESQN